RSLPELSVGVDASVGEITEGHRGELVCGSRRRQFPVGNSREERLEAATRRHAASLCRNGERAPGSMLTRGPGGDRTFGPGRDRSSSALWDQHRRSVREEEGALEDDRGDHAIRVGVGFAKMVNTMAPRILL